MRQNYFSRNLLVVLILTAVTVFVWIGIETYQILNRKEFPKVVKEQLDPLDPSIDAKFIEDLSLKKNYLKEDLGITEGEILIPSPSITPITQ